MDTCFHTLYIKASDRQNECGLTHDDVCGTFVQISHFIGGNTRNNAIKCRSQSRFRYKYKTFHLMGDHLILLLLDYGCRV